MNEMDFRHYDPALGRFNVIDPMAEKRNWLNPYNFVQNNPILRIDPTGLLDDYGYDTETGDITLIRKTDDATDKLVDSKTNETISSEVEKGVLKDGQNIKKNGLQTSQVSAGGKLAVDISMHTNEEVVSVVYQNDTGDRFLEVRPFDNNSITRNEEGKVTAMNAGTSQEIKSSFTSSDGSFTGKPIYSIHTHPGHPDGLDYIGSPDPSNSDVQIAIQNKAVNGVDVPYYIIGSKTSNKWGKASNRTRYGADGKVRTVQPPKKKKN